MAYAVGGGFGCPFGLPCVSPVLLALLTYVGKEQNPLLGFSLLFVFALGFGQIFLILGLGHESLSSVPSFLKRISSFTKPVLGLALLAVGLYYLSLSFPRTLHWAQKQFLPSPIQWQSYPSHPPKTSEVPSQASSQVPSEVSSQVPHPHNLKSSKSSKPSLLYFYADWCLACLQMEWSYFRDKKFVQTSRQFSMFKVNVDDPKAGSLLQKYRIRGIPAIIFLSQEGAWRSDLTVRGSGHLNKQELLGYMQKALHSHSSDPSSSNP